jgi:hypothetical protein
MLFLACGFAERYYTIAAPPRCKDCTPKQSLQFRAATDK